MRNALFTLQSCPKRYTFDQDKSCSPTETVARFQRRLQATGLDVLKEIRRIDTGRLGIPVYFSVCGEDARELIGKKQQMGKGATPEQAQASACMELAERFSFFSFLKEPGNFLIGDYAALEAGHPVLPVEELLRSVNDQSLGPDRLRELLSGIPLRWTMARRLSDNQPVLVPLSWFYTINEFNGASAGNTPEEAVLQGVCEVVERHVCARITHERLRPPQIDQDSITDPVACELLTKFRNNGIEVVLSDFSLDMGIPTVAVLAWDPATWPQASEIVYTAGTTPGAAKAVIRALTEAAQLGGDFNTGSCYLASGLPKPRTLDEVDHIRNSGHLIRLADMTDLVDADIFQELMACTQALHQRNMDVLTINTTHPRLGIPAAYTIIAGAQFRERARSGNAGLFAARLAADLLTGPALTDKLTQMERLVPGAYYLPFYRGRILYEQGEATEALHCFEEALSRGPNDEDLPSLHSYQGACLRDLARYDEAIAALHAGLAVDADRSDLHNALGVCFFKTGRHEEAVHHFQHAVALNPSSAIDHANLALNLEHTGRPEEAVQAYEVALSLDPDITFAAQRLATLRAASAGDR
ncbi:MAG: YcaO-like family protein [Desulfobulbus sp.]|jgi:ribosomal protein S12 methylthiotransferase accessory factor